MIEKDPVIVTESHYDKLDSIQNSELLNVFKYMPKPVVHHCHLSGSVPLELLVQFTYYRYVYYSEKENKFYVNQKGCTKDGYIAVNALRQYAADAKAFDKELYDKMKLQIDHREDHKIWGDF